MKRMFNKIITSSMLLCMGLLGISEASAQNFEMNTAGAVYNATCNAVIKMKNASSAFVINSNNFGSSSDVIDGLVDWAATSGTQNVQALYYTRMQVSGGGSKNIVDGVFVMGISDGTCTPLAGYSNPNDYPFQAIAGTVIYNGTFNYGGAGNQNIWPNGTSGGPDYVNLNLVGGGDKVVLDADAVSISGQISSDAGTNLQLGGDLTLGATSSTLNGTVAIDGTPGDPAHLYIGSGSLVFNANVNITDGSINAATGDGAVTVASTSTLALAGNTSILDFGGNTNLVITGNATNAGDGTNLLFACNSTVTYNGNQAPQNILPTIASNPYGALALANGNKMPYNYAYDNVYVCSTFDLQGGNLNMYTNNGTLYMKEGAATYSALAEVEGNMTRINDFVGGATQLATGTYTYNNTATTVALTNGGGSPTTVSMNVRPGLTPFNGYVAASDVKRSVTLTHDASADFGLAVQVGYKYEEGPVTGPYWDATYTQNNIRMYEGFADNTSEKLSTGVSPNRTAAVAATSLGHISLPNIKYTATSTNSNGIDKFYSSNNIILRSGPTTFYSITDGRWTNPNTWDEGTQPSAADNVEIRTAVYVGIDGPFIGTNGGADNVAANNTLAEKDHYAGNAAAANTIVIANGYTAASLIIGNEDNGNNYVFHTAKNNGTSFTNNNTNVPTVNVSNIGAKGSYANGNGFQGLFLTTYGNSGSQLSAFGTYQLLNVGSINNMGIIEIGE